MIYNKDKSMRYKKFSLRESRNLLPFFVVVITAVMAVATLFLGDIAGVADDGSLTEIMSSSGLSYVEGEANGTDYFVNRYVWKSSEDITTFNLQIRQRAMVMFS